MDGPQVCWTTGLMDEPKEACHYECGLSQYLYLIIIMAIMNLLWPMCTLTTMRPLVTLHPLNPLSKIGNQKPINGILSSILCRMAQENPNAWRVISISLTLA